jgi:hypothetical protein
VYELLQLLGMKNVRLEDVRQMITETDKDGSGSVDFDEFLQARTQAQQFRMSEHQVTGNTWIWDALKPKSVAIGVVACLMDGLQQTGERSCGA